MPVKSHRKRSRKILCPDCGYCFSIMGLSRHQRSSSCKRLAEERPLREAAQLQEDALILKGKKTVVGQVANAITSRNLEELTGLEVAETGFSESTYGSHAYKQFWVFDWVARLWHLYRVDHATDKFYARLVRMKNATEEERESEIGLILLKIAGS